MITKIKEILEKSGVSNEYRLVCNDKQIALTQIKGLIIPSVLLESIFSETGHMPTIMLNGSELDMVYTLSKAIKTKELTFTNPFQVKEFINSLKLNGKTIGVNISGGVCTGKVIKSIIPNAIIEIRTIGERRFLLTADNKYAKSFNAPHLYVESSFDSKEVRCIGNDNIIQINSYIAGLTSVQETISINVL